MERRCTECNKKMELWYMMNYYEEWFCNDCELYHEYKDDELLRTLELNSEVE